MEQKRILVVDDASLVRMYNRQVLEAEGFLVEEALNGVEALEKLFKHAFDLMLVDVNMPKMDGYTFLRKVRQESEIMHIPAIMISTEAEQKDIELAYAAGANLYLIKPVRPDILAMHAKLMSGVLV